MKIFISENNIRSNELLKNILKDYYNIINPVIIKNDSGKPYLKDLDLYYNISHSKDLLVIAFNETEIGVDIEYHNNLRRFEKLVNHYFFNDEQLIYDKTKSLDYFYLIWTKKESYSKFIGTGIIGYFNNLPSNYRLKTLSYKIKFIEDYYTLSISSNSFNEIIVLKNDNIIMEEINE